jgi:DnaJ-class molecular chaperone
MKVKRHITDAQSGRAMEVEEILTIDVKPGWKAGTKVTFAGKGDEGPDGQAGAIQFVVQVRATCESSRASALVVMTASSAGALCRRASRACGDWGHRVYHHW